MKLGILYATLTAFLFVTLEPVSKLIAEDVTPYTMTFWRFLIGSVMLLPFALREIKKREIHITKKDIGMMTLLGILCICFSMVALQVAVKMADTPSLIAIIFSSNSVFTILFAVFIVKEKLNRYKVCALAAGIIGVIICADFGEGTNLASVALALFAALSFSLYTVLSQKYTKKVSGVIQSSFVFLIGSIVLFVVLLVSGTEIMPPFDVKNLSVIAYLAFFVTGLGYVCYFKAIEKGGAMMASMAFFIKPVLTPFVTFFVNGITPDIKVFAAVVFIVIASCCSMYAKKIK